MTNDSPLGNAKLTEFGTNNYGDRNATYNNNIFNSYTNDRTSPPASGREILVEHMAPTALHSSEARNTRTGCLEGTRVDLIGTLSRWVKNPSKKHRVCWVFGGAGVGKSATAQTICENFRCKSQLAASFFFSRNDTSRSTLDPLFPTLAHQLATMPVFRKAGLSTSIEEAAREFPSGLQGMNLEGQFQSLIFQPCAQIDVKAWKTLPRLVVIDGLDECTGGSGTTSAGGAQETFLSIIHKATSAEPPLPLQFMIFSRPESTIRDFFQTRLSHHPIDLREFRAGADDDIRKYLEKEFNDITKSYPGILATGAWPGENALENVVCKADGHFVYVVTVMKYITANNPSLADLRKRLNTVLRTGETTSHPDLSDLDQLYHAILRPFIHVELREKVLLPILQIVMYPKAADFGTLSTLGGRSLRVITAFLNLDAHQCSTILSQLRSVIHFPNDEKENISILHASFSDFLGEEDRSHEFHARLLDRHSYLDHLSCCSLSILGSKMLRYQRQERFELEDELEMWSLKPWRFISDLWLADDYTPSEELVSAIIDFNLYEYLNMILDQYVTIPLSFVSEITYISRNYAKKAFRGVPVRSKVIKFWNQFTSRKNSSGEDRINSLEVRAGLNANGIWGLAIYWELFYRLRLLTRELLYLQDMCNSSKFTSKNDSMQLYCSHLSQFFEGDWSVILPSNGSNRKTSLARLGCVAFFSVRPPPGVKTFTSDEHFNFLFEVTAMFNLRITPTLIMKVLPHRELERARREFSGGAFQICLVNSQQRARFAEEVKAAWSPGDLFTSEFRDLVVKILTDAPTTAPQPNNIDDTGESGTKGAAVSQLFRAFSWRVS
ncbi:hypothetical protein PM082_014594 [Marasmius tenuissimus]|nr:hypothetical protein PM082_014594 [Marasmius tenuissimus]